MRKVETTLTGVYRIVPNISEDFRGSFTETYNREFFRKEGLDVEFVQDDISISSNNVLRGLHGDDKTYKLVSCVYGRVYLVVVNCDRSSDEFGKWESFILSEENKNIIFIPPMYANGYYVLSDRAIFTYKQSTFYGEAKQFAYRWDDGLFNIWWPCKAPLLSERDGERK